MPIKKKPSGFDFKDVIYQAKRLGVLMTLVMEDTNATTMNIDEELKRKVDPKPSYRIKVEVTKIED